MTQFGIGASLFEIKGCKGFKGLKNNGLPGVEGIDILCNFNKPRIAPHGASLFFGLKQSNEDRDATPACIQPMELEVQRPSKWSIERS
ncbi:hypothetical protein CUMW_257440 [Citrus unshiu]|uniref:Uncharacterized protein n=1 Tax=Citrus unshiu TaxID=55188 RepID=A0A2H5QSI9_CITUN|nr:hypothetical protein CUMW_257440 [Citrus unshiu]